MYFIFQRASRPTLWLFLCFILLLDIACGSGYYPDGTYYDGQSAYGYGQQVPYDPYYGYGYPDQSYAPPPQDYSGYAYPEQYQSYTYDPYGAVVAPVPDALPPVVPSSGERASPTGVDIDMLLQQAPPADAKPVVTPTDVRSGVGTVTQFFAGTALVAALGVSLYAISQNNAGSSSIPPYIQPPGENTDDAVIPCPYCLIPPPAIPPCRTPLPGSDICTTVPTLPTSNALIPFFVTPGSSINWQVPFHNARVPYNNNNGCTGVNSCSSVTVKSWTSSNYSNRNYYFYDMKLSGWQLSSKDGGIFTPGDIPVVSGSKVVIGTSQGQVTQTLNAGKNNQSRMVYFVVDTATAINKGNIVMNPYLSDGDASRSHPIMFTGMFAYGQGKNVTSTSGNYPTIYNEGIISIVFGIKLDKGGPGMVGVNAQMFNIGTINSTGSESTVNSSWGYGDRNLQGMTGGMMGFDSNMYNKGTISAHYAGGNDNVENCRSNFNSTTMNCAVMGMLGISNTTTSLYSTMYNSGTIDAPKGMMFIAQSDPSYRSSVYMYNDIGGYIGMTSTPDDMALMNCRSSVSYCTIAGMHYVASNSALPGFMYNNGTIVGETTLNKRDGSYGMYLQGSGNIVQESAGSISNVGIGMYSTGEGYIYNNGTIINVSSVGIFSGNADIQTGTQSSIQMLNAPNPTQDIFGIRSNKANGIIVNGGSINMNTSVLNNSAYGIFCSSTCMMYNGVRTNPPTDPDNPSALPEPDQNATIRASIAMQNAGGTMVNYGTLRNVPLTINGTAPMYMMNMLGSGTMVNYGLIELNQAQYTNATSAGFAMRTTSPTTLMHNAGTISIDISSPAVRVYAYNSGSHTFFNQGIVSCNGGSNSYACMTNASDLSQYVVVVADLDHYGVYATNVDSVEVNPNGMRVTADFASSTDATAVTLSGVIFANSFTGTNTDNTINGVTSYSPLWTATATSNSITTSNGTGSRMDVTMTKNTYVSLATPETLSIASVLDDNYKGNPFYASFNVATVDAYNEALLQASGTKNYGQSPSYFTRTTRDYLDAQQDWIGSYDAPSNTSIFLTQQSSANEVLLTTSTTTLVQPQHVLKFETGYRYQNFGNFDGLRDLTAHSYRFALGHRWALSSSVGLYNALESLVNVGYTQRYLDYGTDMTVTRAVLGHEDYSFNTNLSSGVYKKLSVGSLKAYSSAGLSFSGYNFNEFQEQGNADFALHVSSQHTRQFSALVRQEVFYAFSPTHHLGFSAQAGFPLVETGTTRSGQLYTGEVFMYDTSSAPVNLNFGLSYSNSLTDRLDVRLNTTYYMDSNHQDILFSLNARYVF